LTKKPLYKQSVYETLEWVQREMTSKENGLYSSLDADSEGEEGRFYVWTADEIKNILGNDAELFMDYYDVSEHGNWEEGKNVLRRKIDEQKIAERFKLSLDELNKKISVLKEKVFKEREKRIRPGLDDKILTSWNALMMKGYADAYRVFGEKKFLDNALDNARFILSKVSNGDRLFRNYKNGRATIDGFLDDYALTIDAFIALYEATFDEQWLKQAKAWTDYVIQHFHDDKSGMFFYTSNDHEELIARKMEISDNVIPSSNSVMAKNLYVLGQLFYNENYINMSAQMFHNVKADMINHPSYYANWASLACWLNEEPFEIAIVGDNFEKVRTEFDQQYLPNVLFLGGIKEGTLPLLANKLVIGKTTIYVCRNKTCKLPVTTVGSAIEQMKR
jgi:uncharacterized protein YyaL (SSP411 family)